MVQQYPRSRCLKSRRTSFLPRFSSRPVIAGKSGTPARRSQTTSAKVLSPIHFSRDVVAVSRGETPDRTLYRVSPAVKSGDSPVVRLDNVEVSGPDYTVSIWDSEESIDFLRRGTGSKGARGYHKDCPSAGVKHGSIALGTEGASTLWFRRSQERMMRPQMWPRSCRQYV